MKTFILSLFFFGSFAAFAQDSKDLILLDQAYEKALLESNVAFLENLLSDDFVWVHNHAGLIDGKSQVIARAKRIQDGQADTTKGRLVKEQKLVSLEDTFVIYGITVVDRGPSPTTYHFMRTYVWENGKYTLLANHTMAIPDEELK